MSTTRDTDNIRQFPTPPPDVPEPEFRDVWTEAQDSGADTTTPTAPVVALTGVDYALAAVDRTAGWWRTASQESRVLAAIYAAIATVAVLVFITEVAELAIGLVRWVVGVSGSGSSLLAGTDIGRTVAEPVTAYLTDHAVGLPVSAAAVVTLWAVAAATCWAGSLFGWRGARVGWTVVIAGTGWMVYAATPAPGREAAVAVALAVAALVSIPAYRRPRHPRED